MAQDLAPNPLQRNRRLVNRDGDPTELTHRTYEQLWRQVCAGFVIVPCVAATTVNSIALTPRLNGEGGSNIGDGMAFSFTADLTTTGAVVATIGDSIGPYKVFCDDGATQAGSGDVVSGRFYHIEFAQALDSGVGGLVLIGVQSSSSLAAKVLPFIYPVDCIYITTNPLENPNTTFGFGTWTAFGPGQALVGYANGDPDFGTVEGTGGEKTHALTPGEAPPLTAPANATLGGAAARVQGYTGTNGTAHNNLQPFIVVRPWKRTA